jgi:hypothetical protein
VEKNEEKEEILKFISEFVVPGNENLTISQPWRKMKKRRRY